MIPLTVICAAPPNPNPGMASVDLGFASVARRAGWDGPIRYVRIMGTQEVRRHRAPGFKEAAMAALQPGLDYQVLRDPEALFAGEGPVVFWGDFLHQFTYQQRSAEHMVRVGVGSSVEEARTLLRRIFLMNDCDEATLGRAVLFGGTLLYNRRVDLRDTEYHAALQRFLKGAAGAWFRDPLSAVAVQRLRGWPGENHLGVDAALLMDSTQQQTLAAGAWASPAEEMSDRVGVFFGRVYKSRNGPYARFAGELIDALGRRAAWLPWWPLSGRKDPTFTALRRRLRDFDPGPIDRPPSMGDLLAMIGRCSLVVTDTYHLAVNAWRMGVPAVCIGFARSDADFCSSTGLPFGWTDKRHLFYAMYDALSFYVHADELAERRSRQRRVQHIRQCLDDAAMAGAITGAMRDHARQAESRLGPVVGRLLEKGDDS